MKFKFNKPTKKGRIEGDFNVYYLLRRGIYQFSIYKPLKGVFEKNERGYRLNAIKKRF